MKKVTLYVEGMVCNNCVDKIEKSLIKIKGIKSVKANIRNSSIDLNLNDNKTNMLIIERTLKSLGYDVIEKPKKSYKITIGLLILLFGLFYIIKNTVGFNYIPEVDASMGYGLVFIVGLLTSIHCIAMCGGIALSQSVSSNQNKKMSGPILYNIGRVISYTTIGGIVGGIGQIITPSGSFKGIVSIIAGIFMLLLGLKMLNIISLPSFLKFNKSSSKFRTKLPKNSTFSPLYVGLANGFMPCGPLQTMQLYALGTGSVLKGAMAMFFFSIGTVPLMLGFGAITSILSGRLNSRLMKASAILVIVLGLIMTNRGLALSGITLDFSVFKNDNIENGFTVVDGKQIINMTVSPSEYTIDYPFVKVGVPVKINVKVDGLSRCNNPIGIYKYGVEIDLTKENVMEFTPDKEGPITISCWMGMITTKIQASNDINDVN